MIAHAKSLVVLLSGLAFVALDVWYFLSMTEDGKLAYGRVVAGVFLQAACLAYVGTASTRVSDRTSLTGKAGSDQSILQKVLKVVVPAFLFGTLGCMLVFSGTHEADLPITYRGAR